ncbi:undecaprenyldiphospho-muramoylpentapeptide beta-N-acetylglucosaminyltransferase [Sporanaerobacter acetigenes]|uniref:UDP-N-acetylglucosamine--N-acetylmuramyl-(pentapeptide) pyrophosphoryl-undecaprenol N-acetylglucosamine transferase n=1 Tax=Sporanaerobacter acetigenes DSM 13106 TaxID=1123281 RepID=A0A1M5UH12_9FIRM|nr:undecaprenyldiphospho-muramoylpentapeptide beta-N-acetylglucosaminyltransferase [Sporanaerobacter acetigenes]SHH62247.1 UDP-N-acetylglucosamine-N-acetylmuramylpentapeptide N-acetylglucosamine transferase [Sporanaerobacter acetigenes DSM 13106]
MNFLITGGGTGGHIYPALAIANEIKERHKDADILYVGTEKGMESELVPKEGFNFKTIRVQGFPRKFSKDTFKTVKELFLGIGDAKKIIKEFKPDVVIGTGGYVCGPVVYVASKRKIPTLIHEQNAFPGVTNKILCRYVDKVAGSFEESKKYFKYPEKVVITGNPVRKSLATIDREGAYKELGISPDAPFVLSFGGSGGQKKLNEAMYYVISENTDNPNIQILHITGKRFYDDFIQKLSQDKIVIKDNIKVLPYFFDMPKGLNLADLVITSAGAITLSEITAIGVPSIIIPKAYTAENHQEYNARALEKQGASLVILEKDLTGESLNEFVLELLNDKGKLKDMAQNSKKMGKINAVNKIADMIDDMIK